jgi:predicted amino acid dehydrogenase
MATKIPTFSTAKNTQIGVFGLKTYHLAILVYTCSMQSKLIIPPTLIKPDAVVFNYVPADHVKTKIRKGFFFCSESRSAVEAT